MKCFYPSKAGIEKNSKEKKILETERPFNFAQKFPIYNLFSNPSRIQFTAIHWKNVIVQFQIALNFNYTELIYFK